MEREKVEGFKEIKEREKKIRRQYRVTTVHISYSTNRFQRETEKTIRKIDRDRKRNMV